MSQNMWALLIGIDDYQAVPKLRGCVSDVQAVQDFLLRNLTVPQSNIKVLLNDQANRANIIRTFQEFLIHNPNIKHGDQIFFHYSGHGSQMKDLTGLDPNGLNETIVAWDSRKPGVPDIPDKVTRALLDQLVERKGENVTLFLDCCHSGGGTRKVETDADAPRTRQAPADGNPPPLPESDLELIKGLQTRGTGPSGWETKGIPYTLLAACRDEEEANEYRATDEAGNYVWSGAFTHFLLKALRKMSPDTTYAQIHDQVAVQINSRYPTQFPQCEGKRDRVIFGNREVERDPFLRVRNKDGDLTVEAGLIHEMQVGDKLAVYPLSINIRDEAEGATPLAEIEITSVLATRSQARFAEGSNTDLEEATQALVSERAYSGQRQSLVLEPEGDEAIERLRAFIHKSAPDGKNPPYLSLLDDASQPADLRVVAEDGKLTIYNRTHELLVMPEDINNAGGDVEAVLNSLHSIARYRNIMGLTNQESGSKIQGKIKLGVRQLLNGEAREIPAGSIGEGGELTLTYDSEVDTNNDYVIDVTNTSKQDVYPYVLGLSADYSIIVLYPTSGQQDTLKPGNTLAVGLDPTHDYNLLLDLEDGWDYKREYLKVIATTSLTDFRVLEQEGLNNIVPTPKRDVKSPLDSLLDTVATGSGKRFARRNRNPGEDWATAELAVATIRGSQTTQLDSSRSVEVSNGLEIEAPAGFNGNVQVSTLGQSKRSVDGGPDLALPPGLTGSQHLLEPIGRAGTRSVGTTGLVMSFEMDEASRTSVTKDTPLKIKVPTEPGDEGEVIPVVFDGEDYLPVGYTSADGQTVEVVNLPETSGGEPSKRGLGRTVKLFLYKKMGRHTDLTGLRYVKRGENQNEYVPIDKSVFKAGDKVALMVHGFTSDTGWMKDKVVPFLHSEVLRYDHYITWDYETYGTPIKEIAEALANALRQMCGFGPADEMALHVYSHSMGTIVSRTMIELMGGHEFTDRAILAGPPNEGSTLANAARGGVYLTTVLLNQISLVPVASAVNWGLKQLYEQNLGGKDLEVNSDLLKEINGLQKPDNTAYLVLAGNNTPDEKQQRMAQKILDKGLDGVFGENNDLAIGLSSLRRVRGEGYPNLTVREFPCDHFAYYGWPDARADIKAWVNGVELRETTEVVAKQTEQKKTDTVETLDSAPAEAAPIEQEDQEISRRDELLNLCQQAPEKIVDLVLQQEAKLAAIEAVLKNDTAS